VDAGGAIGTGHVMRCLTLAAQLRKSGAEIVFVCRPCPAGSLRVIADHGYPLRQLEDVHGRDWALTQNGIDADAAQTRRLLESDGPIDWLVIDHYSIDSRWEVTLERTARFMLVLDDLANRKHQCTALCDPLPGTGAFLRARYSELCNGDLLLGPKYALVRDEFLYGREAMARPRPLPLQGALSVHVYFGSAAGSAWARFSRLIAIQFPNLTLLVIGPANDNAKKAELEQSFKGRVRVLAGPANMASTLCACDIAVGAPGSTTWERACLGIPAVYLATAENQVAILRHLDATGYCRYLGEAWSITDQAFSAGLGSLLGDAAELRSLQSKAWSSVDGRGSERLSSYMASRAKSA
jgi:UDP-2,4-diacetamido-2,4,6-trideoxy-beta-L-altropyranose hydrolase